MILVLILFNNKKVKCTLYKWYSGTSSYFSRGYVLVKLYLVYHISILSTQFNNLSNDLNWFVLDVFCTEIHWFKHWIE